MPWLCACAYGCTPTHPKYPLMRPLLTMILPALPAFAALPAGTEAIAASSEIELSAAQNYAMCEAQISAARAYLAGQDKQFDTHRAATSAIKLAQHGGCRDGAVAQEVTNPLYLRLCICWTRPGGVARRTGTNSFPQPPPLQHATYTRAGVRTLACDAWTHVPVV